MAVWSCLKSIGKLNTLGSAIASLKNLSRARGSAFKAVNYIPVRASHERTIIIRTSTYPLTKLRDLIVLYMLVGTLPLIAIVTYVNVFIGPAELALIPEDYEPKHWEYYKHPITRFLARYAMISPQEQYERNLHNVFITNEISEIKKLRNKVKQKMKERLDYQAWYFEKATTKYGRKYQEDITDYESSVSNAGYRMPD